jgi:hypothetical protein
MGDGGVVGRPWYDGTVYTIGSGTIGELVGDFVAYRSLRPCDQRLADFPVPRVPPRKIDRAYGEVVGDLLQRARSLASPGTLIRRIIMIGDNAQTDGAAFENLCAVNNWQGTALLIDEQPQGMLDAPAFVAPDQVIHLQHWHHLRIWADDVGARWIDQETVILLDIDKTLLGARGRNDRVIDDARSIAMRDAVAQMLGSAFDDAVFAEARHTFNHRRFHHLTGDNQDYVGYLCLVVGAGVWTTKALEQALTNGDISSIDALVASVRAQEGPEAAHLHTVSAPIIERIAAGDPTPFKAFRVREYYETVARMNLHDSMPVEERLQTELVLTAEVFDVAQRWRDQGALLFALSDKPDEAALPPPSDQAALSLHHVHTHIVSSTRS